MAEEITYYAIVDDYSSRDRPAGVLRRFIDDDATGRIVRTRPDLGPRSLLHSAEHGDYQYEFIPITEDEASQIVARIREAVGSAE